jgi:hypothetical protein
MKKCYKGGSFPFLILFEEIIGDLVGMLPNTRWVAAHLAKTCACKLALLETFIAFQLRKEERYSLILKIKGAKCQEEKKNKTDSQLESLEVHPLQA